MRENEAIGQDSFLDIVANLVGILIILVVIIGAQAATVWQQPQTELDRQSEELERLTEETQKQVFESRSIELENNELNQKLQYEEKISNQLSANRMRLLIEIEANKKKLETAAEELDVSQRAEFEKSVKLEALKQKIQQVKYEYAAVDAIAEPKIETIEHFPTPIAKTVFSDEVHFLINGNRISHVPLDELIVAMKNEWKIKAKKLPQAEATWESVGPIGDFRLQYLLRSVVTHSRQPSQLGIEFDRFVVQPVTGRKGEEIPAALTNGSVFESTIRRMVPRKTTVSIWVYPDGYDQLIEVRSWLRSRGYLTASWPLQFGQPISGGPNGFRTSTN